MPKQLDAKNLEEEGKKILKEQAKRATDTEEKSEFQKRMDHDPSIPRHKWIHYHRKHPTPTPEEPPPEP